MSNKNNKKLILVVLDGWGVARPQHGNAIGKAKTPTMDMIERSYYALTLQASGIGVGLPWGREGNSEVGHMNLGAGRIVYQYLPRIVEAIRDGSFFQNEALKGAMNFVKNNNSTLHIMGLLSSGNVHSYIDHLYALLDMANKNGIQKVVLHPFTDGKDSPPHEATTFLKNLRDRMKKQGTGEIGTIVGRAYAMDRNNHWDLTQKTYELLTQGKGQKTEDPISYLENSYEKGLTDFDIEPGVVYKNEKPIGLIEEGDAVIFFNFREDSARQITKSFVLSDQEFSEFPRKKIPNIFFVGMTEYQEDLPIEVAFPPPKIDMPLAEVISNAGLKQLHIAETEKYAHVTYFFNGQKESPLKNEDRILVPSMGTPHYDDLPEMQAYNITQQIMKYIREYDFFLINYANADMLGHTGNWDAALKGIEAVDANISSLVKAVEQLDMTMVITADHGNAEAMINSRTGAIITQHSINPVPFFIIGNEFKTRNYDHLYNGKPQGVLGDVAPTVLKIMGIDIPPEMTGKPLI
ncbi:MAG: 2,3-bisphosphoglycerate-independent phosphoglycerate mutase [Candidatus Spechtbacterales bacterium]|nr:2,3-bisphosphoglycerate-independent phosphoglycerate mutase [Candidatus Spechtbacterales bacterium]